MIHHSTIHIPLAFPLPGHRGNREITLILKPLHDILYDACYWWEDGEPELVRHAMLTASNRLLIFSPRLSRLTGIPLTTPHLTQIREGWALIGQPILTDNPPVVPAEWVQNEERIRPCQPDTK